MDSCYRLPYKLFWFYLFIGFIFSIFMWEMFYLGMNQEGEEEEEEEGQVQLGGDLGGRPAADLAGRLGGDPHQQDPNHRSKTGVEGLSTGNNFGLKSVFHFFPLRKDFLEDLVVF